MVTHFLRTVARGIWCLPLLLMMSCENGDDPQGGDPLVPDAPFLLGAHYYVWYPSNFDQGYLRRMLNPPQAPVLGRYYSDSQAVAEQHIAWAADCGIDFFTLNYWPTRPELRAAMERGFLSARNLDRIKFCIFYGTGELGSGYSQATGRTVIDAAGRARLVSDMLFLADHYFNNSSYLRVQGRPVVIFYTTRVLVGEYAQGFREARAALEARGVSPFFIADEIFWNVLTAQSPATSTSEPQVERIRLFDAITAYNLYSQAIPQHAGYLSTSAFIDDSNRLMAQYSAAVPDVPVLPVIIPGYNDRGTRPQSGNFAIPREAWPGGGVASGLAEMYDRVLVPNLDALVPIGFITTWNEWNEDSAIEPLTVAPPAGGDPRYTDGYLYEGFGSAYLDFLRSRRRGGG